jgi:ankyrin repeat protein
MKYVNGQTLNKTRLNLLKQNGKITLEDAIKILFPIANALDYAHRNRVIHRDIKPDNILIDEFGVPFIIDFGLSAQIHTSMTSVSRIVTSKSGTLIYKSPEQWQGELQDAKTDQYSFGVLAYEFLSGRVPFIADTVDLLGYQVLRNPVPKVVELSDEVNEIFTKVLAREREERYENCIEFMKELKASPKETLKPLQEINYKNKVVETNEESKPNIQIQENEISSLNKPTNIHNPPPEDLFDAVRNDDLQKVKDLINAGVSVNTRDKDGSTPLYYAASNNNVDILQYLISQWAEVNVKNNHGSTPLHYAMSNNANIEIVNYLVSPGAKLNTGNIFNKIPHDRAIADNYQDSITNPTPEAIFDVVRVGNLQKIKNLINFGVSVNVRYKDGTTPLHYAACYSVNVESLKYLVSQGAEVNVKSNDGTTPLHYAAGNNANVKILEYLVTHGAEINVENNNGTTPLHYAAGDNANIEILKYLISQGADVNARNKCNKTPLDYAIDCNYRGDHITYLKSLTDLQTNNSPIINLQSPSSF